MIRDGKRGGTWRETLPHRPDDRWVFVGELSRPAAAALIWIRLQRRGDGPTPERRTRFGLEISRQPFASHTHRGAARRRGHSAGLQRRANCDCRIAGGVASVGDAAAIRQPTAARHLDRRTARQARPGVSQTRAARTARQPRPMVFRRADSPNRQTAANYTSPASCSSIRSLA